LIAVVRASYVYAIQNRSSELHSEVAALGLKLRYPRLDELDTLKGQELGDQRDDEIMARDEGVGCEG
jgi:hypothetical protein